MASYFYTRRVAFHETDAAGIVHFANFFKFAAEAETRALDSLGILMFPSPWFWPRVHVEADYKKPLRFNDEMTIEASIVRIGSSSLHWEYEIRVSGELCAVVLAVSVRTGKDNAPAPYNEVEREAFLPLMKERSKDPTSLRKD